MASDLEELDLISAVWILASNDEDHLITYEGIRERLHLGKSFDVRKFVLKRRELFRPGAPPNELKEWQDKMREGRRLPTWIKLISDGSKRLAAINGLSENDVFRSQFRAIRESPKSQGEIVSWGLDYIDRLRKSKIASREASVKSWQMWLVFAVGILNIITIIWFGHAKFNESNQFKPKATIAQPVVPGDASQAGFRPPVPCP